MLFISDPRKKPLKAVIVLIAIASSMALFLTLSSLGIGIKESSREALDEVGADVYVVPESLNPLLVDLQSFDQGWAVIREIESRDPLPSHISPRLKDTLFFNTSDGGIDESIVYGIVPEQELPFEQFKLVRGSWFQIGNDPLRDGYISSGVMNKDKLTGELLISEELQGSTGLEIGETLALSARIGSEVPFIFEIKGVFVDALSKSSRSMLVHLGELQFMKGFLKKDTLTEILVDYPDGTDLQEIIDWSESESEEDEFLFKENVDLLKKEDLLSEIYKFISILEGFSMIVISVTLLVCLIFTSTIFMISTKQRSLDLAILRAIGFHPIRVFYFVVREAMFYYIAGSVLGIILGLIFNYSLNLGLQGLISDLPSDFQLFSLSPHLIVTTLLAAFILSVLSALLPAIVSARRSPINAIRGEL